MLPAEIGLQPYRKGPKGGGCGQKTKLLPKEPKIYRKITSWHLVWQVSMTERLVKCSKLGKELPGLAKQPFGGETGTRIFEQVSAEAWRQWQEMQIKVINEYRLNMANTKDYQLLIEQMLAFLNLKEGPLVEVENAERGRKES
jgi:Fe-S cluster biosynthesis and repair protein YggX